MKMKKIREKSQTKHFINPEQYFCEEKWEESSGIVGEVIWGRNSVLKFLLPYGPNSMKTIKKIVKNRKMHFLIQKPVWGYGPGQATT